MATLEQPITVEYLNGVVQHHLFERKHKGDMAVAQQIPERLSERAGSAAGCPSPA